MRRISSTCTLVALLLAIGLTAVPSYAYWSESFEYDDSPLNHGWVQEGPDTPVTTTEQAKSGSRSLRSDAGSGTIVHYFPGDTAAERVSAWFYDDGDYCTHCEANVWTQWDGGTQFLGLGKYLDGGNYHVFDNIGTLATAVPVSAGWHLFEWVNAPGTIVLHIDGTEVASYTGSALSSVGIHAGEVGLYADDVRVYSPSPPGRMLFGGCRTFVSTEGPGLFVSDPDGGDVMRVVSSDFEDPLCVGLPDWSPDGRSVVLNYDCQLAVMALSPLLPSTLEAGECSPCYASDLSVIYACGRSPKWSPTGDRIAFTDGSICLINPDGTGFRSLTPGGWEWDAPGLTWTTDGQGIVYQQAENGHPLREDLYMVSNLDGPGEVVVTQLTATPSLFEKFPTMSPDGTELAYSEGPAVPEGWDGRYDPVPNAGIRVSDYPDMSTVRVLTDDPGYHDHLQAWSPDGQYTYFSRECAGYADEHGTARPLWRVKADGSEPEEPVPGLVDWKLPWGGVAFMKRGVYATSTYALPGYTNIPLSIGVVGAEDLAGIQAQLQFRSFGMYDPGAECCSVFESMDWCQLAPMIAHWTQVGPYIDQTAGTLDMLAYGASPETDAVTGSGELLDLSATTLLHDQVVPEGAQSALSFELLELSDDWGDPIDMGCVSGGVSLIPFRYLEVSQITGVVQADDVDPVPIPVTIRARGEANEALTWPTTELTLYLERTEVGEYGPYEMAFADVVSPTSVALVDGIWSGEVEILEDASGKARLLAKWSDFGGYSNSVGVVGKGDPSGDDEITIFDVIKVANMAIGRGVWEPWQWWAADLNRDEEVNIFDVVICAGEALSAMETTAIGRWSVAGPSTPAESGLVVVATATTTTETGTVVTVELSNCAGLAGIQVELDYDPTRLRYSGVSAGPLLEGAVGWAVSGNDLGGAVRAIAYSPSLDVLRGGEGTILTFAFDKLGKKKGKVTLTSAKLSAVGGIEIPAQLGKGKGGGKARSK